ncbi:MAG: 50S ribosomal protein L25/general stress protein Ctc [Alphaproteobacteria bacterium]|nr:50S ribosomal protein L25/general stress protein Ctc [Alphaproteobacteria bacterium]MBF0250803.1 50S ribosomal protein L25/general stress protein Ctc [Alphaproteobacteria bacterium]
MATFTLNAEKRERAGKGAARATRRAGRVPAVVYGDNKEPIMISVVPLELKKLIQTGGFFSHLVEINVDGKGHRVIARDIQLDPVTDRPIHVDFMRVSKGHTIAVNIPLHFINELAAPGIKRGGVLNAVRHEVELNVDPDNIPEFIEIDLTGLDINDSVHISNVKLPAGSAPTITDRDFTIATIAAPSGMKAEAAQEGEEEGGEE